MTKEKIGSLIVIVLKIILILFLIVTLNKVVMPKYISENQDGRITGEYYRSAKYDDVIFVGSSTVFSGINPGILWEKEGISSFVRANASQPMWISYYMVEDALRCRKPELVCIDTTFIKYDDDFVEEPSSRKSIDGMRLSLSKLNCIKASMGEDEKMLEYIIPLFRFHTRWKELKWEDIRYAWYNRPVTLNGYIEDTVVEGTDDDELIYTAQVRDISPKNVEYLRKTIELCQSKGVSVFVFKMPSHSPNWNDDFDRQINGIAGEYGVTYINFDKFNDDIGLDYTTDTPDAGSHLNSSGAAKFSEYLAKYIRDNYNITDRRSDRSYGNYWNKIIK